MKIKGILVTLIAPFENHIANGGDKLLGNMPTIKNVLMKERISLDRCNAILFSLLLTE